MIDAPLSSFSSLLYSLSSYSSLECQSSICSLLSLSIDYSSWYIPLIESGLYIQLHQCVDSLPPSLHTSIMRILQNCGDIGLKQQMNASAMTTTLCQLLVYQLSTTESPIEYDLYCVYQFVKVHSYDVSSLWSMLEKLSQTLHQWSIYSQLFHFVIIHSPPSTSTLLCILDTLNRRHAVLEAETGSYLLTHCSGHVTKLSIVSSIHFNHSTMKYLTLIQHRPLEIGEVISESISQGTLGDEVPYQWLSDHLDGCELDDNLTDSLKCQIRDVLCQFIQSSQLSVLSPLIDWMRVYPAVGGLCLHWLPSLPLLLVTQWDQTNARVLLESLTRVCEKEKRI